MSLSKGDAEIEVEELAMIVDGIGSFNAIDFAALTAKDILMIEFINLQAAYDYYNEYGRIKGFSMRRSKVGQRTKQGSNGEIIWKIFVCSRQTVKEGDLYQINSMRKAGLRVPTIFHAFSNQSGGFETIGFEIKDIYNAIEKQRLQNLFWCDGTSRYDCSVFGNVLGFDAMYGRNKYKCPLVIFLGVDHHMRTVVFNYVILNNESEDSYVWLLRPFLEAMKGKPPKSVMTDGDLVIKSTVGIVFPGAHYRLCSWHLLRNATAKVGRFGLS
ncbi:hypothetical protein Ahy_B01g051746 isoform B [Arachis hypogaea]|uniref:MULE transposase domain-containing protein n=1 Tax=Arachis hypogaea TaxID=3818 RepID=A0A445AMT7_ARAHY|nr:hypothetical protein Ahy_B01g051746 isoform B [Arachis hypogaea]